MGYEPVGRIRPIAPAPSILTAARPLPDVNWSSGISWVTGCQQSFVYPLCPPAEDLREAASDRSVVHTVPFTVYTPAACDLPTDTADLEALTREQTEVHTASAVADAVWMGTGLPDDDPLIPTLRRSAIDVSGNTPYDLDDGIAALLVHYQECSGGEGGALIHMPGALLTGALGGGGGGARVCWPEGNLYRGPHGSLIVAGPGYPEGSSVAGPNGHGPLIDEGPPADYAGNEAGTAWLYITGPIEYAVSTVRAIPEEERQRVTFRQNTYDVWGERDALVRFDPCCVFAVEVYNNVVLPEVS